jgi:hypothetical protein
VGINNNHMLGAHAGDGRVEPIGRGEVPGSGVHRAGVEGVEPCVTVEILADEAAILAGEVGGGMPGPFLSERAVDGALDDRPARIGHHADRAELVAGEIRGLAVDEPDGGTGVARRELRVERWPETGGEGARANQG